jgi:predicted transcriptional regulator
MEFEFISAVASTLVGATAAVLGEYLRRKRQSAENKEKPSLTERVRTLTESLNTSTALISEIQLEIEKRHQLVTKLQKDTEHYEALSKLKEKETEAVAQLLQGIVNKDSERSFYKGVIVNFVFFTMGLLASYVIPKLV